ncbi:hypothetical protein [Achromobacter xylosoxidans]|uniref:hypothetical protein n=1 Tax=Alcaligenes xylosoxydans xylosoxydans TaxID=85698 RepID=UPI000B49566D|nr:hypothetical protein [Achromobacter xylosoxidans]
MHWLLFGLLGVAACTVIAALLRQPGVWLYDWIATRAIRRQAALRQSQALIAEAAAPDAVEPARSRPVTQAG